MLSLGLALDLCVELLGIAAKVGLDAGVGL